MIVDHVAGPEHALGGISCCACIVAGDCDRASVCSSHSKCAAGVITGSNCQTTGTADQ